MRSVVSQEVRSVVSQVCSIISREVRRAILQVVCSMARGGLLLTYVDGLFDGGGMATVLVTYVSMVTPCHLVPSGIVRWFLIIMT